MNKYNQEIIDGLTKRGRLLLLELQLGFYPKPYEQPSEYFKCSSRTLSSLILDDLIGFDDNGKPELLEQGKRLAAAYVDHIFAEIYPSAIITSPFLGKFFDLYPLPYAYREMVGDVFVFDYILTDLLQGGFLHEIGYDTFSLDARGMVAMYINRLLNDADNAPKINLDNVAAIAPSRIVEVMNDHNPGELIARRLAKDFHPDHYSAVVDCLMDTDPSSTKWLDYLEKYDNRRGKPSYLQSGR